MVVALRTLHGQAEHGLAHRIHPVEHRLHAELLGVGAALGIDHRIAQETRSYPILLRRSWQQVARDLLDDKPVIRHVGIQCVDDPVAVEPDLARLVFLEAV